MGWNEAFEVFPVLETERFILRKIELSDALSMFRYLSRAEVMQYYDLEPFNHKQEVVELIESLLFRYKTERQIRWGITTKEENTVIGTCGFHALEHEHFKAEIGYELHPGYWRKGAMTEVVNKVVEYGFMNMELNRIEAFYHPVNYASHKVLEKNGFHYEGILRKRFYKKGEFIDAALASLLIEDIY